MAVSSMKDLKKFEKGVEWLNEYLEEFRQHYLNDYVAIAKEEGHWKVFFHEESLEAIIYDISESDKEMEEFIVSPVPPEMPFVPLSLK